MKFLICGMGSIGVRHFQNLKKLGHNDIILYSTGQSVYPDVQNIIANTPRFSDINEALSHSPDVCIIANPTSLHVETALLAAKHGCHLYIEKPLSHSLEGLEELNTIVDEKNLITLVTYQFRHHPHIRLLRDLLVDEDKFGRPLWVSAQWSEYLPDWHPWEDYKKGYSARKDLGGGVLLTQIHPLNYLSFIFGGLKKLTVLTQSTGSLGIDVEDIADIQIEFENAMTGVIHIDYLQKPRVHKMTIVTTSGRFEWDCHQNTLVFLNREGQQVSFPNEKFERNDMFVEMLENYISCIKSGKQTVCSIREATRELSLLGF